MPTEYSVLSWQMNIFKNVFPSVDITVITGYKHLEYVKNYPDLEFLIDLHWERTNP